MSIKTFFSFKAFIKECNEKDVIKRLTIYLASSWVLLQVLEITWKPLGLPEHSVVVLILVLLTGLPTFILLLWKYHLAPLEKQNQELDENEKPKKSPFRKMYFWSFGLITTFCMVAIISVVQTNFGQNIELPEIVDTKKIAVLKFGNNTGEEKLDVVGKMSADWIIHGITENQVGQAISQEIIEDYESVLTTQLGVIDSESIIKEYLNPSKIISGNYYLQDDQLLFQCTISDGRNDDVLISFKQTVCDLKNPLNCIEDLKQDIIGYLATEKMEALNIQEYPPKYEAYQNLLLARANYDNDQMYIEYLNSAIAIDSTFFEPKILKIAHYYNLGNYRLADSLRQTILPSSTLNKRQRNFLNHYEALLKGDNRKIYATAKKEYDIIPFDLQTNATTMVVALQYVYKPESIDSIYKVISMKDMDLSNCVNCQYRYYIKALADIELNRFEQVVDDLSFVTKIVDDYYLKIPLFVALIKLDDYESLNEILDKLKVTSSSNEWASANIDIAKECLLVGNNEKAKEYLNDILMTKEDMNDETLAKTYYYLEEYNKASTYLEQLHEVFPEDIDYLTKLLIVSEKTNQSKSRDRYISQLNNLRTTYQFGAIDYALAQYYAAVDDSENTLEHLRKSIADGNTYAPLKFHNDFHFKDYINLNEFKELLTFWH